MAVSFLKGHNIQKRPFKTVGDCLQHFSALYPEEEAVVFCSTTGLRSAVSWKKLCKKSYLLARAFVGLGVKPGECVAVVTRTCPEWLYVTFGAMLAAARVTTIVFKDGRCLIKLMEKIGNCSLIVVDPGIEESNWNILKHLLDECSSSGRASSSKLTYLRQLIFIYPPENENFVTVNQILEKDHSVIQLPEVNPNDTSILLQTSGSTGIPKLVAHTYASFIEIANIIRGVLFPNHYVYFDDRPFGWGGGFPFGVFIGQKRVTVSGFCPEPANKVSFTIDVIQREKCVMAGMFTNMIHELNLKHEDLPADWPLKVISTGGQPITKAVSSAIGRVCKALYVGYGVSEVGFVTILVVKDPFAYKDYATGYPLPGVEVKVVNKDGEILPRGERGELYVRNLAIFKEYLNEPEKTTSVKTPDGWFKTDDLARIDWDGCVFIEGRISDIILSGETLVIPAILEAALKTFPGVQASVVVPVQDELLHQVVCACVCVEGGSGVTEANLREFIENVYTICPKYYLILNQFPREDNGKISRKRLKTIAEQKFRK